MKRAKAMSDAERTDSVGKPVRNKILLSVSDAEYRRICPHLKFVPLAQGRILHAPGKKACSLCIFPIGGLVSIVVASQGGRGVEAGVVGYEGAVGTALTVGLSRSPLRHVVQIAGNGFRLNALALQSILPTTPNLQMRLSRYAVLQWNAGRADGGLQSPARAERAAGALAADGTGSRGFQHTPHHP